MPENPSQAQVKSACELEEHTGHSIQPSEQAPGGALVPGSPELPVLYLCLRWGGSETPLQADLYNTVHISFLVSFPCPLPGHGASPRTSSPFLSLPVPGGSWWTPEEWRAAPPQQSHGFQCVGSDPGLMAKGWRLRARTAFPEAQCRCD